LPLVIVGIMQGVFETAFDLDSNVDWEYSSDGKLEVEITPFSRVETVSKPLVPKGQV
jgi:hypothetical protein